MSSWSNAFVIGYSIRQKYDGWAYSYYATGSTLNITIPENNSKYERRFEVNVSQSVIGPFICPSNTFYFFQKSNLFFNLITSAVTIGATGGTVDFYYNTNMDLDDLRIKVDGLEGEVTSVNSGYTSVSFPANDRTSVRSGKVEFYLYMDFEEPDRLLGTAFVTQEAASEQQYFHLITDRLFPPAEGGTFDVFFNTNIPVSALTLQRGDVEPVNYTFYSNKLTITLPPNDWDQLKYYTFAFATGGTTIWDDGNPAIVACYQDAPSKPNYYFNLITTGATVPASGGTARIYYDTNIPLSTITVAYTSDDSVSVGEKQSNYIDFTLGANYSPIGAGKTIYLYFGYTIDGVFNTDYAEITQTSLPYLRILENPIYTSANAGNFGIRVETNIPKANINVIIPNNEGGNWMTAQGWMSGVAVDTYVVAKQENSGSTERSGTVYFGTPDGMWTASVIQAEKEEYLNIITDSPYYLSGDTTVTMAFDTDFTPEMLSHCWAKSDSTKVIVTTTGATGMTVVLEQPAQGECYNATVSVYNYSGEVASTPIYVCDSSEYGGGTVRVNVKVPWWATEYALNPNMYANILGERTRTSSRAYYSAMTFEEGTFFAAANENTEYYPYPNQDRIPLYSDSLTQPVNGAEYTSQFIQGYGYYPAVKQMKIYFKKNTDSNPRAQSIGFFYDGLDMKYVVSIFQEGYPNDGYAHVAVDGEAMSRIRTDGVSPTLQYPQTAATCSVSSIMSGNTVTGNAGNVTLSAVMTESSRTSLTTKGIATYNPPAAFMEVLSSGATATVQFKTNNSGVFKRVLGMRYDYYRPDITLSTYYHPSVAGTLCFIQNPNKDLDGTWFYDGTIVRYKVDSTSKAFNVPQTNWVYDVYQDKTLGNFETDGYFIYSGATGSGTTNAFMQEYVDAEKIVFPFVITDVSGTTQSSAFSRVPCHIEEIELPSTVRTLRGAFSKARKLKKITIWAGNLTDISYMAYDCINLETVVFHGTVDQWNALPKANWKAGIPAGQVTVVCTDGNLEY